MAREQQIAFADGQHLERTLAGSDQAAGFMAGREVEWMVSDYDLDNLLRQQAQAFLRARDLTFVDAAVFESQRTRRVDSKIGDLGIEVKRLEIAAHMFAVRVERLNETLEEVVQRDIMVARDDDLRPRQPIQKFARRPEFDSARALGEITGDGD